MLKSVVAFFDFIPTSYVQNWDQRVGATQVSHLHMMGVDAIQYRRTNGIRERLEKMAFEEFKTTEGVSQ